MRSQCCVCMLQFNFCNTGSFFTFGTNFVRLGATVTLIVEFPTISNKNNNASARIYEVGVTPNEER